MDCLHYGRQDVRLAVVFNEHGKDVDKDEAVDYRLKVKGHFDAVRPAEHDF